MEINAKKLVKILKKVEKDFPKLKSINFGYLLNIYKLEHEEAYWILERLEKLSKLVKYDNMDRPYYVEL